MSDGIQRPVCALKGLAADAPNPFIIVTLFVQVAESQSPLAKGNHPATPIKTKPRIEKNRVLVTGGAGFVGSHLCTYLVERGDHVCALQCLDSTSQHAIVDQSVPCIHSLHSAMQVICLDNFFTGSKENVKHLLDKTNFEIIRHDVVEKILLEVDQIYHLACPASPIHYKSVQQHTTTLQA